MPRIKAEITEALKDVKITEVKQQVGRDAWIALKQYFAGANNGTEAKVACVVIGVLAKEEQSKNNARQIDIIERRLLSRTPYAQVEEKDEEVAE